MSRPKNWDELSKNKQEAWRVKKREIQRKHYEANREKVAERKRKYQQANRGKIAECQRKFRAKTRTQADADRFFQLMGAAEELTKIIKQRQNEQTEKMGRDE